MRYVGVIHSVSKPRMTVILPIFFACLTAALWFWSEAQYRAHVRSLAHVQRSATEWEGAWWTDYTPIPLVIAGALNVPVATFVAPLYALVHPETSTWKLFVALLAVWLQWSYVGWVWDQRAPAPGNLLRRAVAVVGILFGAFILIVSIPMFHVGYLYKCGAFVWAVSIWWHFGKVLLRRTTAIS